MHEKAKFVCFIYMKPQKMKFKSVQINMKHVLYKLIVVILQCSAKVAFMCHLTNKIYKCPTYVTQFGFSGTLPPGICICFFRFSSLVPYFLR